MEKKMRFRLTNIFLLFLGIITIDLYAIEHLRPAYTYLKHLPATLNTFTAQEDQKAIIDALRTISIISGGSAAFKKIWDISLNALPDNPIQRMNRDLSNWLVPDQEKKNIQNILTNAKDNAESLKAIDERIASLQENLAMLQKHLVEANNPDYNNMILVAALSATLMAAILQREKIWNYLKSFIYTPINNTPPAQAPTPHKLPYYNNIYKPLNLNTLTNITKDIQ